MYERIFIIDDDPDIVAIATKLLKGNRYHVASSRSPRTGIQQITASPPDLVLLDICMDEMDGLEVCKQLKSNPKTSAVPVIMISVNAAEADVVVGLEMGAEDYIRKPFLTRELLARVKTVLRRQKGVGLKPQIKSGPFELDYSSYRMSMDGKPLNLSPKEFELMGLFLRNEGRVLTRATIYESIWGADLKGQSRTIDSHIDTLRKKLGTYRTWIQSLKGVGYRFEQEEVD